jgi:NAD(P)-dependent dehydrogenase (short-subunit alcohol dehydrogenase family)
VASSPGQGSCHRCCALRRANGHPVGERHEVAVGCADGGEVVGSFLELLAQVEDLLFELADAGAECLGVVGIYHASKWALEGLSEALAQEVRSAGIKVTLIEPGAYGTDWAGSSASYSQPNPAYQPFRDAVAGARSALTLPGPQDTADAILAAADAADPPLRLLLSGLAYDLAQRTYAERQQVWTAWETVSRAADTSSVSIDSLPRQPG